jgi:predicted GIY-YIG superfamily endonuclease
MSDCHCDNPTTFRATAESGMSSYLYLRCGECGGKAGRLSVDEKDMREHITNPEEVGEEVSIRFEPHDSFFLNWGDKIEFDDEVSELYGKRRIRRCSYWVYVLECSERFRYEDFSDFKRRAKKRLQREPDWLRMAWEHQNHVYIGQTENLFKRLGEHFEQNRTTDFTELYKPREIKHLEPARTRVFAERREKDIGKGYYDNDRTFAYWK